MNPECFTTPGGQRALATDDGDSIVITPCVSAGAACSRDPSCCPQAQALANAVPPVGRRYNPMQPTIGDLVGKNPSAWQFVKVRGATAFDTADAPDDCFAVVPDAARGPRGNKSLRKLPLVSVERKQFDPVIVRNALTMFKDGAEKILSGTGVAKADALGKICYAARELGIDSPLCTGMEWYRRVNVPPGRPVASAFSHFFDPMQYTVGDLVNIDQKVTASQELSNPSPPVTRRIDGRFDPMQPTVGELSARGHTSGRTVSTEPDDFLVHPSRVKEVSR